MANRGKGGGKANADTTVTDLDLQALVDMTLDESQRRDIMKAAMASPQMLERLEELILQNQLLKEWWVTVRKE